jgi:hypothetical protein
MFFCIGYHIITFQILILYKLKIILILICKVCIFIFLQMYIEVNIYFEKKTTIILMSFCEFSVVFFFN